MICILPCIGECTLHALILCNAQHYHIFREVLFILLELHVHVYSTKDDHFLYCKTTGGFFWLHKVSRLSNSTPIKQGHFSEMKNHHREAYGTLSWIHGNRHTNKPYRISSKNSAQIN